MCHSRGDGSLWLSPRMGATLRARRASGDPAAQHVRPYVRRNKTDRADAADLLEAARCGDIRPVPVKTPAQQVEVRSSEGCCRCLHTRMPTRWYVPSFLCCPPARVSTTEPWDRLRRNACAMQCS